MCLSPWCSLTLGACGDDDDPEAATQPARSAEEPAPGASPAQAASARSDSLASVLANVNLLAPALESYFRTREYPRDVGGAVAALPRTGLKLSPGNSIGGYRYKAEETEVVLCVENASGAWAICDTAPMTTGRSGETGGCPPPMGRSVRPSLPSYAVRRGRCEGRQPPARRAASIWFRKGSRSVRRA